jgi:hypothetical protein
VEKGLELSHSLIKGDDFFANVLIFVIDLQKVLKVIIMITSSILLLICKSFYDNILNFVIDLQKCFCDNYDNVLIFVIDLLIRTMLLS